MLDEVVVNDAPVSGAAPDARRAAGLVFPVARRRAAARAGSRRLPSDLRIGAGVRTAFVHTDTEETRRRFDRSLPARQRPPLRERVGRPPRSSSRSTPSTTAPATTSRCSTPSRASRSSDKFNVWAGRMLPPSDRANLYGPYYAHHWAVFTDGVQDGYPFVATGRDNGVVYWGQFGKVKVRPAAFDGPSATGNDTVLGAGRVMVDFWDPEPGYYLNSTYYGDKNILAIGVAGPGAGRATSPPTTSISSSSERWAPAALLGRSRVGEVRPARRLQRALRHRRWRLRARELSLSTTGRHGPVRDPRQVRQARFREGLTPLDTDYDQKTSEINFNYVMKQFNSRVMIFYKDTRFDAVQPTSSSSASACSCRCDRGPSA